METKPVSYKHATYGFSFPISEELLPLSRYLMDIQNARMDNLTLALFYDCLTIIPKQWGNPEKFYATTYNKHLRT